MRKYTSYVAVGLALALSVGTAQAADTSFTDITISGTVANTCNIPNTPVGSGASNITISSTGASGGTTALAVTNLADGTTGFQNAGAITLTYGNAVCNYATFVSLQTTNGGMTGPGVAAGFKNRVDYTATATFGGGTASITTDGTALATNSDAAGPAFGDLVVDISIPADLVTPLIGGAYADTVRVQIGTAL